MLLCVFSDGCFRCSDVQLPALPPAECTRSCWTSSRWTAIDGNMSTVTGCRGARPSPLSPTVSTSTRTHPTSGRTGWKRRCHFPKSNWPTKWTAAVRLENAVRLFLLWSGWAGLASFSLEWITPKHIIVKKNAIYYEKTQHNFRCKPPFQATKQHFT